MKLGILAAAAALSVVGVTSASAQVYIADPYLANSYAYVAPPVYAAPPPGPAAPAARSRDSAWACHPGRAGLCGTASDRRLCSADIQLHDQQPSLWGDLLGLLARLATCRAPSTLRRVGEARIGAVVLQCRLNCFAQQWIAALVPPIDVNIGE